MSRRRPRVSQPRMAQPEPWMEVAAVKWAWKASKEPKCSSRAAASSPVGLSPPSGERFCQKVEWLTWPPRLKARVFSRPTMAPKSPLAGFGELVEGLVEGADVGLV